MVKTELIRKPLHLETELLNELLVGFDFSRLARDDVLQRAILGSDKVVDMGEAHWAWNSRFGVVPIRLALRSGHRGKDLHGLLPYLRTFLIEHRYVNTRLRGRVSCCRRLTLESDVFFQHRDARLEELYRRQRYRRIILASFWRI
jgi:hypothetical protein